MPTMVGLHGWLQLVVVVVVKGMGMDGSCMDESFTGALDAYS